LDIWKFQLDCRGVAAKEPAQKKQSLDALDMQIIECLQTDVRLSNRRIAATLDVSESNIRVRIRRMLEQKQLRLTTTHAAPGYTSKAAFVGISVSGGHSDVVCKALALLPEVSFVCTALGRYEIICCVNIFELEDLAAVVHEKIAAIPHVRDSEPLHCLQQVKHQVLLGLIL
jgi:Lrp/AsnC family transcriptional regulator for asnA, asnC and gidA